MKKLMSNILALSLLLSVNSEAMASEKLSQDAIEVQIAETWLDLNHYRGPVTSRSYRFYEKADKLRQLYKQANREMTQEENLLLEVRDIDTYLFVQKVLLTESINMSNINWVNSEIERLNKLLPAYEKTTRISFVRERINDLVFQKRVLEVSNKN